MKTWHYILIAVLTIAGVGAAGYFFIFKKKVPKPAAKAVPAVSGAAATVADQYQDAAFSDGSYLSQGNYIDSKGNHVGWLDVNGNIWSDADTSVFLGTALAGSDGLPFGGLVSKQGGSVSIADTVKKALLG